MRTIIIIDSINVLQHQVHIALMTNSLQTEVALEVKNLHMAFSQKEVLNSLSFSLNKASVGCLLGASGCGKTTALRAIAGFAHPQSGEITVHGKTLFSSKVWTPPEKRNIGVVFQDYALFPHLSVQDNIAFGLKRGTADFSSARIREMLELTGLSHQAKQFPHELSGGQQQRVALARALAPAPELILLDEPFSNLDPDLRERLALDLRDLLTAARTTALLVTHDQYEAFALADVIGVMEQGNIAQWDSAYNLYHQPTTRSVADFVGQGAFVTGQLRENAIELEIGTLKLSEGELASAKFNASSSGQLSVLLRPDDVTHDDASSLTAQIKRKAFRGAQFLYTLRLISGTELFALVPSHHDHEIGEWIGIRLDADHSVSFPQ
jgi:iron(III) transport system ATP-binding protein